MSDIIVVELQRVKDQLIKYTGRYFNLKKNVFKDLNFDLKKQRYG